MREELIKFLDRIREYQRESDNNIGYDDRESSVFVDIYLEEKDCNFVNPLLAEVRALIEDLRGNGGHDKYEEALDDVVEMISEHFR